MNETTLVNNFIRFGSVLVTKECVDQVRNVLHESKLSFFEQYHSNTESILFSKTPHNFNEE